ncbi:hypothetical protein SKAU_G00152570 [Synaphobranchus kaupii]|uniref:Uncharacterized protein n=1 Tax=Synaphobranchus kaupii TaxID=118154 RepID=A0A9Q1FGY4_SYNKA|nr:hypothetical protein SKAU_G00152570 [Synaphobranchus kaupii]
MQGLAADSAAHPEADAGEGGSEQAQRTEAQGSQDGNDGTRSADFETQPGIVHGEGQTTGSETPVATNNTAGRNLAEDGKGESRAVPADVAAGKKAALSEQPTLVESGVNSEAEDMDDDSDSDSLSARSDTQSDIYTMDQINDFLNETFGKPVKVKEYFPDINKFIRSCAALQKNTGLDVLDEKKRFRLRKHVTALRKSSVTKLGDLVCGGGWRSASELAREVGMRSTRLMQQLLEGIRAAFPASHSGALQKIFRLDGRLRAVLKTAPRSLSLKLVERLVNWER